ncbi:hypothetical protein [Bradyrhizobium sp. LHD-71]|uniref:hypothetical protein n=1 Tax=Bradyrhizobium sp. LHD-71 TaxID=3072141 RepID=UPI00280E048D|nr:hypothetical protein [Bradyrhizobium sp. LHD-71]MDQ8729398.1 hypothetical protein [Bradyrhizobium sp. LHD-71]
MDSNQDLKGLRDGIGRGLSSHISVDDDVPEPLKILLRRLKLAEAQRPMPEARDGR